MQTNSATRALRIYAGETARKVIQEEGLRPERIKVLAGAAGGPKWLVLHGLDRRLPLFFEPRERPLFTIGASIGAWRFLSYALGGESLDRFREGYIEQRYLHKPTKREVTQQTWQVLHQLMDGCSAQAALSHPFYHMGILAARSRHLIRSQRNPVQGIGLAAAALSNLIRRKWLKYSFERILFYDRRHLPPFFTMNDFPTRQVPLTTENLGRAVVASGSIPLVMEGIPDIPGAKAGIYYDGGILDYHIDIDFLGPDRHALILFPHYTDRIIPGWLDKHLPRRTPRAARTRNLVLLAPSREFVQALPYSKIPDRNDFTTFFLRDTERIAYWRKVVTESERLGDEFVEAAASGAIRNMVRPLPWQK